MGEPETSIVEVSNDLSIDDGRSLLDIANRADALVGAIKKIKTVVCQITNPDDWIDEQGKPYLQVSGAEKIATMFGIEWEIQDSEAEEDEIGHRTYKFKGTFTMKGRTVSIIGSRSSKDPFFSRARGNDVLPSNINMANVEKAAYTNTIGNGITRILGIRNMTWEELAAAGLSKQGSRAVKRNVKPAEPQARCLNFGRDAGKPLSALSFESLEWYADILTENMDDPKKARFKKQNTEHLAWVHEAMEELAAEDKEQPEEADDSHLMEGYGADND